MKYRLLIIVFVFFVCSLASAENKINISPQSNNETSKEVLKEKKTKKKQKNWPPTFIPSEKINADSSVSFPVDI